MTVVFFDLDGTLEDSRQDMVASIVRTRRLFGLETPEPEKMAGYVTRGMDYLYRNAFSELFSVGVTQELHSPDQKSIYEKVKDAYCADYIKNVAVNTRLYPGISDTLSALSEVASLAVITNKPEIISQHLLEQLGVLQFIKVIMGGDSCPETKPSPLPLRIAKEKIGIPDDAPAFMVGDSAADMQVALNFGAKSIWCAWGYSPYAPEPAPDFIAETPVDILKFVVTHG